MSSWQQCDWALEGDGGGIRPIRFNFLPVDFQGHPWNPAWQRWNLRKKPKTDVPEVQDFYLKF